MSYSCVDQFLCVVTLQYLDALFQEDTRCGSEYHEMQVELYAKYEREKLLPFLRLCNDIPLQKVSIIYTV